MDVPQLFSIEQARARLGGISRAKIDELLNNQKLESVMIDGQRLIARAAKSFSPTQVSEGLRRSVTDSGFAVCC